MKHIILPADRSVLGSCAEAPESESEIKAEKQQTKYSVSRGKRESYRAASAFLLFPQLRRIPLSHIHISLPLP